MLPVAPQVPVAGSNSSALAKMPPLFWPPATNTFPFCSKTAMWFDRAVPILPVFVHVAAA
jgi:hypothetical protein